MSSMERSKQSLDHSSDSWEKIDHGESSEHLDISWRDSSGDDRHAREVDDRFSFVDEECTSTSGGIPCGDVAGGTSAGQIVCSFPQRDRVASLSPAESESESDSDCIEAVEDSDDDDDDESVGIPEEPLDSACEDEDTTARMEGSDTLAEQAGPCADRTEYPPRLEEVCAEEGVSPQPEPEVVVPSADIVEEGPVRESAVAEAVPKPQAEEERERVSDPAPIDTPLTAAAALDVALSALPTELEPLLPCTEGPHGPREEESASDDDIQGLNIDHGVPDIWDYTVPAQAVSPKTLATNRILIEREDSRRDLVQDNDTVVDDDDDGDDRRVELVPQKTLVTNATLIARDASVDAPLSDDVSAHEDNVVPSAVAVQSTTFPTWAEYVDPVVPSDVESTPSIPDTDDRDDVTDAPSPNLSNNGKKHRAKKKKGKKKRSLGAQRLPRSLPSVTTPTSDGGNPIIGFGPQPISLSLDTAKHMAGFGPHTAACSKCRWEGGVAPCGHRRSIDKVTRVACAAWDTFDTHCRDLKGAAFEQGMCKYVKDAWPFISLYLVFQLAPRFTYQVPNGDFFPLQILIFLATLYNDARLPCARVLPVFRDFMFAVCNPFLSLFVSRLRSKYDHTVRRSTRFHRTLSSLSIILWVIGSVSGWRLVPFMLHHCPPYVFSGTASFAAAFLLAKFLRHHFALAIVYIVVTAGGMVAYAIR